jgi:hypothetical protein
VSKQKERLEKDSLTEGQKRLLESIPRWDLTSADFHMERQARLALAAREHEAMRVQDLDAKDVEICYGTLLRDQRLLRAARDTTADVPYFYLKEPRVPTWDPKNAFVVGDEV